MTDPARDSRVANFLAFVRWAVPLALLLGGAAWCARELSHEAAPRDALSSARPPAHPADNASPREPRDGLRSTPSGKGAKP